MELAIGVGKWNRDCVFSDQIGKEDSDFIFMPRPRLRRISYEARKGCTDSIATSYVPSKSNKGEACKI